MKNALLIAIIAGALSGALSGLVVGTLMSDSASEPAPTLAPIEDSAWVDPLEELREEARELRNRIGMLESRPQAAPERQVADEVAIVEAEVLREELEQLVGALRDNDAQLPDSLKAGVTNAVRDLRAEEERERDERRRTAVEQRIEDDLAELTSKLGLDNTQVAQVRTVMQKSEQARTAAFTAAREQGDFGGMREKMRSLRQESNDELQKVLTPVQFTQYEEWREGERDRDRGGRGGDRGGRGPRD